MSMDLVLLKSSFEAISPIATEVVNHFYNVLFHDYPDAQKLFDSKNMPTQQKALIGSLVFIVGHLEDTGKLIPYLHELGRRHRDYGVQSHHYNWVSTSFLKTLSHFFGETWSPELEISWKEALTLIAEKMKAGAAPSEETIAMQIEKALKEMIETTLSSIVDDADIRNFVKTTAQVVLREAIEKEMRDLQNTFKSRHAA